MNVIIIEDEKLSADHLINLLKKVDDKIEVVATFESVKESIAGLSKGIKHDLLFVDIHLADGLSFEIFSKVKLDTPIIFTTAYDEYAIKAFKLNSIDYLLKPLSLEDLKQAIAKYKSNVQKVSYSENLVEILKNISKKYKARFMVKSGETIASVKSEDIESLISDDGVVVLFTTLNKRYVVDYTLDEFENMLDPKYFFRINRKAIININSIQKVTVYFNSRLKITANSFQNEEDGIVSRERVNDFKAWLGK
jgi:DNA-binding LytR/AlgR family response regulator